MRRAALRPLLAVAVAAALLAGAPGAQARPSECPAAGARTPRELPLVLPDGTRLVVRDGSGGVLSGRVFRFSLRGTDEELGRAGTVRWYLDGRRVALAEAPPYVWRGRTDRLRAGRRTVTVQAEVRDGVIASTSFGVRVVRCG